MIGRIRALTVVLLTVAAVAVAGCERSGSPATASDNDANKPPDQVTYVTGFGTAGHDAFAWVAQEKGFFREAGIEVTIQPGAAGTANLQALTAGRAQFTYVDLTGSMIQAGKGTFKDFRAIAAVHQQTLVAIFAPEGSNITSPKDLEGKKVGAATGAVTQTLLPAYARLAGFDASKVTIVNSAPQGLTQLLASGQVNALSTFVITQGNVERVAGKKMVVLPFSEYLSDLLGTGLITTAKLADENPDLVKRFRDAALKGLKYTIENPEEAAQILNKAQPASNPQAAVGEIRLSAPYVTAGPGGVIGVIDEQRAVRAIAILQGAGLIPAGLTPASVIDFDLTPKA